MSRIWAASGHLVVAAILAWPAAGLAQESNGDNPHGHLNANIDCSACHTAEAWKPAKARPEFDHDESTSFALLGRHQDARCTGCHFDLRFDKPQITSLECAACHVDVHLGNFSNDCSSCHSTVSFNDIPGLSIHSTTSFPLTGSHIQISCESCHRDDQAGAFSTLDTDCYSCHEADYSNAEGIDHVALNLPTDCLQCHGTLVWHADATFDHVTASGGFALSGAHVALSCSSCHDASGTDLIFPTPPAGSNDCIACHQDDYDREHGGTAFPVTCRECHTDVTWDGARFDHAAVGFALIGAHAALECESCHRMPGLELIYPPPSNQNDCVACHQDDYDRVHTGSDFPLACSECHSTNTWDGASFDHSRFFPINTGPHGGADCETCHIQPGNFQVFSCFSCHQHSQDRMDRQHSDENGYVYDSNACYSCHPNGRS
ncbi:MAG: hypothetical protein JSU87_16490 [Gemmatimonadota bacterium]|nr:MAG: hypothetical protein JSU87_16490 [Gemmatimonadota bacterium]